MKRFLIVACIILLETSSCFVSAQTNRVKNKGEMLGADISFLPQLEAAGRKFYDAGVEKDAILILKDHGVNYIRLRIFNNPKADSGYSAKGFCDLENTKKMALRIKAAHLKFLLDFHYSDNWADPAKQHKPSEWANMSFDQMTIAIREYTKTVLQALKDQGTMPDMVQVGNEISHGMIWPDGKLKNLDTLAAFINAGIAGVKDIDRKTRIMLHIACGGQNAESRYFIDNMLSRNVKFDIIGESYYPKWHGTIEDLKNNLTDLSSRYKQKIVVVEYSELKREVNDVVFNLPGKKGIGTFIWEPISWGETVFNKDGKTNTLIDIYAKLAIDYDIK